MKREDLLRNLHHILKISEAGLRNNGVVNETAWENMGKRTMLPAEMIVVQGATATEPANVTFIRKDQSSVTVPFQLNA